MGTISGRDRARARPGPRGGAPEARPWQAGRVTSAQRHAADPGAAARPPLLDRTFAAVLFDMDGTLISSIGAVERSWARLAEDYAIPVERFFPFHGIPAKDIVERLLADRSATEREAAYARIVELEVADTEGVEVLPGAVAALDALGPAGRCAVVTSSSRPLAAARLSASGLPVPDLVITADDVPRGKPHPEPYATAAARLGARPADCLVVEDAESGLASGRAAGAATLAVATTHAPEELRADLVVPDLSAVRFEATDVGVRLTRT